MGNSPRDDTREGRVRARNDEEGAKVLRAGGHVRNVDREADEDVREAGEHERVPLLDPVGPDGPYEERRGCEA